MFFFGLLLRNCINCVHNCEDHSSLDFDLSQKNMTVDSQDPEDFFVVKSTTFLFSVNQVGEIAKRKKKKKKE